MKVFILEQVKNFFTEVELQLLKQDFIKYKTEGLLPNYFGKDTAYNHSHTPRLVLFHQVQHLHLRPFSNPWASQLDIKYRTSDYHLVYCQGMLETNYYLFIAVLNPNAHQLATQLNIMHKIGVAADKFRLSY